MATGAGAWSVDATDLATASADGLLTGLATGVTSLMVTVDDTTATVPLQVRPLLRMAQLEGGQQHACGLTAEGEAYCWGSNGGGRLGAGHSDPVEGVVKVVGPVRFAALTAGQEETCGRSLDGRGYCWGNGSSLLGDSVLGPYVEPTPIAVTETLAQIDIGWHRSRCAVTLSGETWCWEHNDFGQLGQGHDKRDIHFPVLLPVDTTVVDMAMSAVHGCAILASRETWCWGRRGAIGRVDTTGAKVHVPAPIAGDFKFESLDSGQWATCGLDADGGAWCWPWDPFLDFLGAGAELPEPTPLPGLAFTSLSVGWQVLCGVLRSGVAKCWSPSAEVTIELPGSEVAHIVAGWSGSFSCAIDLDGAPYCWSMPGEDEYPQTPTRIYAPMP